MSIQHIQPISHFRAHATSVVKKIRENGAHVVLTQNGRAAAVVVSPEEWEATQESLAMLRMIALRTGEIKLGKVVDFDEGIDQIDSMIEAHGDR